MKRWAVRICVFLLLGAVVNFMVAWGCAAWSPTLLYSDDVPASFQPWLDRLTIDECSWVRRSGVGHEELLIDDVRVRHKPVVHEQLIFGTSIGPLPWDPPCVIRMGWPTKALMSNMLILESDSDATRKRGWPLSDDVPGIAGMDRRLALDPIWPGFAINTVFYAAVLWGLFVAPRVLLRWRRHKRGLCPVCGYDLRGRPTDGDSQACPECGERITHTVRQPDQSH